MMRKTSISIRVVDRELKPLVEGVLLRAWADPAPSLSTREGIMAIGRGQAFKAPPRTAHASVQLNEPHDMPLWYGGTYQETHLDFSLPSGLHNVWGQGNDFDTDAYRIHPDDIVVILELLKKNSDYHAR